MTFANISAVSRDMCVFLFCDSDYTFFFSNCGIFFRQALLKYSQQKSSETPKVSLKSVLPKLVLFISLN